MFIASYSFDFPWKGKSCQCTLYKYRQSIITLIFEDYEFASTIGSTVDLYKIDGRLVLTHSVHEQYINLLKEVLAAVEEGLKKPLLWMFTE